ncbi:MAG: aminotransferase class III-fold pyridoxal phosphate-dependent enzyme, partial [Eggerthellaceae bacterium]|nr:aminotransferase class III-fold pyridoxal phosphate-dependent enzyme [Eggerthellaceae bacterium]
MTSFAAFDHRFVAPTYNRFNLEIASGKGSVITDVEGREYIDMGTGIAVNVLGIADEEWAAAVTAQLTKVQHTSNLYYSEPCAMLAAELCTRTGMDKVFFGNSGDEANECAIKVARKYAAQKKGPGAATMVTLVNSFHGRTLATLAATGQDHFHEL